VSVCGTVTLGNVNQHQYALAIALVIGLRFSPAPRQAVRFGWLVLVGLGIQGIVGYTQYFNHLPAGLVWVHVASSVLLWIFVLRLCLATGNGPRFRRNPPPRPPRTPRSPPDAPACLLAAEACGPLTSHLPRRVTHRPHSARCSLQVVAPGVARFEAEHLLGAVDRQQRAELADLAGQRHPGEDLGEHVA
jgi:hypothetical protein